MLLLFQLNYTLTGYPDFFDVLSNTGQVQLKKVLDRETKSEYVLTITASDHGVPTLSSSTKLTVNVLDKNDNSPKFTSQIYKRTLSEGIAIGTVIMTVEATDADIGVNSQILYQIISGNDVGLFTLDNDKGVLRLAKPLNREANATIKLTVTAKDNGKPQLSDQAEIVLVLTDVNDNVPIIHPKKMTAFIQEVRDRLEFLMSYFVLIQSSVSEFKTWSVCDRRQCNGCRHS